MYGQPQAYNQWQGNNLLIPQAQGGLLWPRPTQYPVNGAAPPPGSVAGLLGGYRPGNPPMGGGADGGMGATGGGYSDGSGDQGSQGSQASAPSGPNMGYGKAGGLLGQAASVATGVPGLGLALSAIGAGIDSSNANSALSAFSSNPSDQLGWSAYGNAMLSGATMGLLGQNMSTSYANLGNALANDAVMGNMSGRDADAGSVSALGLSGRGDTASEAEASAAGFAADAAAADAASAAAAAEAGDGEGGWAGGSGGGGGGAKIICNELHRQGLMPDDIWEADERFGAWLSTNDPDAMAGYLAWAPWVVRQISGTGKWAAFVRMVTLWIVGPWSRHMAFKMGALPKDTLAGRGIMAVGRVGCRTLGRHFRQARVHGTL